jgi:hypothetical protein
LLISRALAIFQNFLRAFSSRSLALRLFFSRQRQVLERPAKGRQTRRDLTVIGQPALSFPERHSRVLPDVLTEPLQFFLLPPRFRSSAVPRFQGLTRAM